MQKRVFAFPSFLICVSIICIHVVVLSCFSLRRHSIDVLLMSCCSIIWEGSFISLGWHFRQSAWEGVSIQFGCALFFCFSFASWNQTDIEYMLKGGGREVCFGKVVLCRFTPHNRGIFSSRLLTFPFGAQPARAVVDFEGGRQKN